MLVTLKLSFVDYLALHQAHNQLTQILAGFTCAFSSRQEFRNSFRLKIKKKSNKLEMESTALETNTH